jgi:ABC-type uncharacterized transport system substrate-binding protein
LRRLGGAALAATLALASPPPAEAHPHVFIDTRVTFVFAGARMIGFRENWLFDDVFSDQLLQQFDTDQDGRFSKPESDGVAAGTLPNLAGFHYFTYVWLGGKMLPQITPSDFHASVKNKLVSFDFMVQLPKAIDPVHDGFVLEANDRTYYVQMTLAEKQPFAFTGLKGLACKPNVEKDVANAYYGGFVYPERITLKCQ